MMRTGPLLTVALAGVLAFAAPALAATGRDLRACYGFSDTFPPAAADAPGTDFVDIRGVGTPLALDDDTPSQPIPLPFAFEFFGRLHVSVSVSPNGFLRFGSEEAPTARWLRGAMLPDARSPNGVLAALWKDLDPSPARGGVVTHAVLGAAPDRQFLVQFTNVPDALRLSVRNTFQIALVETSNDIVVRYAGASGSDEGAAAGVEDGTGAVGITWLLGAFALDRAAVRYTPLRLDTDHDGWVDCIDNCRLVSNFDQADADDDGAGDPCDLDAGPVTVGRGVPADATNKNIDATRPGVALDDAGNTVVTWDAPIDGDSRAIAGRWYDPGSAPLGAPFRVNQTVGQEEIAPRVAVLSGGGFAVAWGSSDGVSKQSTIRMQRYAGGGIALDNEQTMGAAPSTFTAVLPAIGVDPAQTIGVAWGVRYEEPRRRPVEVQRLDALGRTLGSLLDAGLIDTGTTPPQPDVAFGPGGDFTVAWCGETGDAIRVRGYDANGVPLAAGPLLLPRSPCDFPAVASLGRGPRLAESAGSVFAAWSDPAGERVFLQRLDDGGPVFPEPLALETPPGDAKNPAVAAWGAGYLLVVWQQGRLVYGQRLARDGRALEPPFAVSASSDSAALHEMPAVAATPDGQAAVVWRDTHDGVIDVALRQMRRCGNGNVDPGEQCDDGNADTGDCCSPACQFEPDGQACDDGRFCTLVTTCSLGTCAGGTPRDCDDANTCTADRCDEPTAQCVHDAALLTGTACEDGSACTQQDACDGGRCQGSPVSCDDGNACTADTCDPSVGCRSIDADGAGCDDADQCTEDDVCGQGACSGTRVCGPSIPGDGGGGTGGNGGGGGLPVLTASRKGVIKVMCLGQPRWTCSSVLFAVATAPAAAGEQLAKWKRAKIGRRKQQVVLALKLSRKGRAALATAAYELPVLLDTIVTERDGTTRRTSVAAILTGRPRKQPRR